jgi:hypothetical protein
LATSWITSVKLVAHMALHRHDLVLPQQVNHQLLQNQAAFFLCGVSLHQEQTDVTGQQMLELNSLRQFTR